MRSVQPQIIFGRVHIAWILSLVMIRVRSLNPELFQPCWLLQAWSTLLELPLEFTVLEHPLLVWALVRVPVICP